MPVEEWQRKTVQLKLRLPPDVAALIRDSAAELEMGAGEYIAAVLRAMHDRPNETAASILEEPRPAPAT